VNQRTNVPKEHAKFNYQVAYSDSKPDSILLDVLLEDSPYEKGRRKTDCQPVARKRKVKTFWCEFRQKLIYLRTN
jgi:hypothetical protein